MDREPGVIGFGELIRRGPTDLGDRGGQALLVELIEVGARVPHLDDSNASVVGFAGRVKSQRRRGRAPLAELRVHLLELRLVDHIGKDVYHAVCLLYYFMTGM